MCVCVDRVEKVDVLVLDGYSAKCFLSLSGLYCSRPLPAKACPLKESRQLRRPATTSTAQREHRRVDDLHRMGTGGCVGRSACLTEDARVLSFSL
jgi:hypothetical protein